MASLLGYMPTSLHNTTLYEIVADNDKVIFIITIMIRELFALNRVCYKLTKCGIVIWTIGCNTSQYYYVYYVHTIRFILVFVLSLNLILIEEVCETSIRFCRRCIENYARKHVWAMHFRQINTKILNMENMKLRKMP